METGSWKWKYFGSPEHKEFRVKIGITAYLLPGVTVKGYVPAIFVAILLAILNTFLKPVLVVLTLPVNILTIGLFTFVINAAIILIVSSLVDGFAVDGFWWALLFSVVLSIVNATLFALL